MCGSHLLLLNQEYGGWEFGSKAGWWWSLSLSLSAPTPPKPCDKNEILWKFTTKSQHRMVVYSRRNILKITYVLFVTCSISPFCFSLMFLFHSCCLIILLPFHISYTLSFSVSIPDFCQSEILSDEPVNSCFLKPLIFRLAQLWTFPLTSVVFLCSLTVV